MGASGWSRSLPSDELEEAGWEATTSGAAVAAAAIHAINDRRREAEASWLLLPASPMLLLLLAAGVRVLSPCCCCCCCCIVQKGFIATDSCALRRTQCTCPDRNTNLSPRLASSRSKWQSPLKWAARISLHACCLRFAQSMFAARQWSNAWISSCATTTSTSDWQATWLAHKTTPSPGMKPPAACSSHRRTVKKRSPTGQPDWAKAAVRKRTTGSAIRGHHRSPHVHRRH